MRIDTLVFGTTFSKIPSLIPGTAAAGLLAWASILLSGFLGEQVLGFDTSPVSAVMVAVLLGMGIGNSPIPLERFKPGFSFAVKKLLRLGIMLLGIRLSLAWALHVSIISLPVILLCIAAALLATKVIIKRLNLSPRLGTLIAVGTSICGVSAIAAVGPAIEAREEEISYSVAVITVFGIIAALLYPYASHYIFSGSPQQVGIFLGTSVHDTSQVTGAAMVYQQVFGSSEVLDIAAVTKMVRNLFMLAVIPLVTYMHSRSSGKVPSLGSMFPLFIIGFTAFAALRSIGDAGIQSSGTALLFISPDAWNSFHTTLSSWAQYCIAAALAGVGLTTNFRSFRGLGVKPFIAGLAAALIVGAVSTAAVLLIV